MPFSVVFAAGVVVFGLGLTVVGLWTMLHMRAASSVLRHVARWGGVRRRLDHYRVQTEAFEDALRRFYRTAPEKCALSTGWCLIGWAGGVVETYVILKVLAPTEGWTKAIAVETLSMTLNNLFVFVPGRIGAAEGVRVAVFLLLGMTAAQGATYGVVRRARELLWTLPGFLYLFAWHTGTLALNRCVAPQSEKTDSAGSRI